ncbi:MAG: hypothetical protein ACRCX7_00030 [Cetobacterium sp.]|uniref:hypothetical protein n=1 Tax=Cetobacterium sp. TaxID=2071632 RepID=UPI003F2D1CC2
MKRKLILLLIILFLDINILQNLFKSIVDNKDSLEVLLSLIAIVISITVYKDNKKNEEVKVMPMFEISLTKDDIISTYRLNNFKYIQIDNQNIHLIPSTINHGYYRQKIKVKFKNKGAGTAFNINLKMLKITSLALKNLNFDLNFGVKKNIKIVNQGEDSYLDLSISIKAPEYEKLKNMTLEEVQNYAGGIQINLIGELEFSDLYFNTYSQKFTFRNIELFFWDKELTHYYIDYNLPPIKY